MIDINLFVTVKKGVVILEIPGHLDLNFDSLQAIIVGTALIEAAKKVK